MSSTIYHYLTTSTSSINLINMKKLLRFLKKSNSLQSQCKHHDNLIYPNLKPIEKCHTCNIQICYLCTNSHHQNHCNTQLSKLNSYFTQYGDNNKLSYFNKGYLCRFKWMNARCPCGQLLVNKPRSAMCVACGTATCSNECHEKYGVEEGRCVFHENFNLKLQQRSLRSIIFQQYKQLFKKRISKGIKFNKTSNHMISALISNSVQEIYLIRGFRQFGNPLQHTLQHLHPQLNALFDFKTNIHRVCQCTCLQCRLRGHHSIGNCQMVCVSGRYFVFLFYKKLQQVLHRQQMKEVCDCKCKVCVSSQLQRWHRKLQCYLQCQQSKKINFRL